jgi:hypothetical protein
MTTTHEKILKKLNKSNPKQTDTIKVVQKGNVRTVIVPKNITVQRLQNTIEAYRSNISNLFTENDVTLTTEGYVRLFTDTGYYGDVQKALTMYEQDDLLAGLIDGVVNVSNTNINFDLPSNNNEEAAIWKLWTNTVNLSLKNTLPGLKLLNERLILSMMLTGMAVPDFEWGKIKVGRKVYEFPTKINIYPSLGTWLQTSVTEFGQEDVLIGISKEYYKYQVEQADQDVAYRQLFTEIDEDGNYAMVRKNAYAIKYKYSQNNKTLYPTPFLKRSFQSIALRNKLLDADISLLEMILSKIIQIKVGDEKNPPQPPMYDENGNVTADGDIEMAQELFESMTNEVEVIATPYHYNINYIMPETDVLLSQSKYVQSTYNILSNFGIILDPNSSSNTAQFEKINLKHYEKNALTLQSYLSGWYTWLIAQIIKRNKGRLKATPTPTFDKPDVYDNTFLAQLKSLTDQGYLDIFTLQEKYGFDPDTIKERLITQKKIESDNEDIYAPRSTFKQEIIKGNETKSVSNTNSEEV